MIIDIILECKPLVSASGVLTRGVTLTDGSFLVILEPLESSVVVTLGPLRGNVRNGVLPVGHSVVGVSGHSELGPGIVSNSGLAEVDHRIIDTLVKQSHTVEQRKGSTETVASNLHSVGRVEGHKTSDLRRDIILDGSDGFLETGMHLAIALRVLFVGGLGGVEVSCPVLERFRSSV